MLLYDNDQARDEMAARYINEGIDKGQLAVYASVDVEDLTYLDRLASRVTEFGENIDQGNLQIVGLRRCYEGALTCNLNPFEDVRSLIEQSVRRRRRLAGGRGEEVVVIADCAEKLSANEKFDECSNVERWWQDACHKWMENGLKIMVICPHLRSMLDQNERNWIATSHNMSIQVP